MKHFLIDLINIIQDKYNESIISNSDNEEQYMLGVNFAYYDILDVIKNQLESFGYNLSNFNNITPNIGKKIEK